MSRYVVPDGLVVKFHHCRIITFPQPGPEVTPYWRSAGTSTVLPRLQAKGGKTIAQLIDANGVVVAEGESHCAEDDFYNKKIGRQIALGRALKTLHWPVLADG